LRYTPAGIAIVEFVVAHQSTQLEAGQYRLVEMEIKCVGIGDIATELNKTHLDRRYRFTGFLARRTRNSRSPVFHATGFELNENCNEV
jgi:primosomal replication protein N